jgi:hypothetical protein
VPRIKPIAIGHATYPASTNRAGPPIPSVGDDGQALARSSVAGVGTDVMTADPDKRPLWADTPRASLRLTPAEIQKEGSRRRV